MSIPLEQLLQNISNYRKEVDAIFATTPTPGEFRRRVFGVLVCTSRLYLDYLLVVKQLEATEMVPSEYLHVPADIHREKVHRDQLRAHLESWPHWKHFDPHGPFSELTSLRTIDDYTNRLSLHLSEIYEESFRVEKCAKEFLATRNNSAGTQLIVGLEHMGRHHISFVQQALESITTDSLWND